MASLFGLRWQGEAWPARPKENPGSGGARGPGPWLAPPERRSGLRSEGPGSPRGDEAPEGALFRAAATLRISFQPQPVSTPSLRASPICFSSPRALHPGTQTALGRRQRPEALARGRPESHWGQRGELQARRTRSSGRRSSGPFWSSGAGVGRTGEVAEWGAWPRQSAKPQVRGSEGRGWPAPTPTPLQPGPRPPAPAGQRVAAVRELLGAWTLKAVSQRR